MPVIESAWNFVCEAEAERGYKEATEWLQRKTDGLREQLPLGKEMLRERMNAVNSPNDRLL